MKKPTSSSPSAPVLWVDEKAPHSLRLAPYENTVCRVRLLERFNKFDFDEFV